MNKRLSQLLCLSILSHAMDGAIADEPVKRDRHANIQAMIMLQSHADVSPKKDKAHSMHLIKEKNAILDADIPSQNTELFKRPTI